MPSLLFPSSIQCSWNQKLPLRYGVIAESLDSPGVAVYQSVHASILPTPTQSAHHCKGGSCGLQCLSSCYQLVPPATCFLLRASLVSEGSGFPGALNFLLGGCVSAWIRCEGMYVPWEGGKGTIALVGSGLRSSY